MITDYTTLQASMRDWLFGRTDIPVTELIQLAEGEFREDRRLRSVVAADVDITSDVLALPADVDTVESWAYTGPTAYGSLTVVPLGELMALRGTMAPTGRPRYVTVVNGEARFAPIPDATYETVLEYKRALPALTDAEPSNWLLEAHPNIYLYGALRHSAPFMQDDERLQMWHAVYDQMVEARHIAEGQREFSGQMVIRPARVLG
jgi:hypothetical protein